MNLGIEYLVRTGAIQKFLQVPCSLFVEHWSGAKLVVSLERKSGRSKSYEVVHYHLDKLSDERLPCCESHDVLKSEIFKSEKVVLPGEYVLLPYTAQPVDIHFNRYNHPMDERTYNHFLSRYLYSDSHKSLRERWLWKSFVNLHFRYSILPLMHYERHSRYQIVSAEQAVIQTDEPEKWTIWIMWRKKFLRSTRVAPELVFQSAYG